MKPRKEYKLRLGDLLVSRASGSPELIGSVGIVHELPGNFLLCDKVYRLTLDRTRVTVNFVAHMLRTHQVREHMKNGISGAEGMANNLPTSVVKGCMLPKMPIADQKRVVAALDRDAEAAARPQSVLDRSIRTLNERRQAVITAAVTGQLDVTTARGVDSL